MEHQLQPTKISQIRCAYGPEFFKSFKKKYGDMPRYTDINKPVLFFGCYYANELQKLLAHQSECVVIWLGSDILWAMSHYEYMIKLKSKPNIKHIAISNFIMDDLDRWDIPYRHVPIVPMINTDITPKPLGDYIYTYNIHTEKYGGKVWGKLENKLRGMKFIHSKPFIYSREGILEVYSKCFIGLRFTSHDGLSNTACEIGLMGRKIIWNGNTPNAIPYNENDIDSIVENVVYEYEHRKESDYLQVAESTEKFLDITDDFLYL